MGSVFAGRLVLDDRRRVVGFVEGTRVEPRTGVARGVVVRLAPEARDGRGLAGDAVLVPMRYVARVRQDALVLDRSLELALRGAEPGDRRAR